MKTIDFSYFIERYNSGEMNETEKEWFLREIEGNKLLRDEVELRAKTDRVLNETSVLRMRNKLHAIEMQRSAPPIRTVRRKHSPIRYAAAVGAVIVAVSIFLAGNRTLPADELIDRYHKPYETIASARSFSDSPDRDYLTALDYFNIHDYGNAADYFLKVIDKAPGDMESTYLYGVSSFEEENFPVASNSFNKVIDNNDNLYIEDAQWYLAMCYLKTDETDKAVEQLSIISKTESLYRKQARKILKHIK
ncbi:MAG: tetratricopeptide repeat protein [Bacteroidales bacterium]|nr:tetratricopeptide repeat protein [Bacteroidales bacterium]